jgi:hypothetical protein
MTTAEIQKLKKPFKIIFRINTSANTTESIQNGDLVQNFNLLVDGLQPGPYEVQFEQVDLVSPNDFSDSERKTIYGKNLQMLLAEGIRCFYPKNINSLGPIPLISVVRANGGNDENFDIYLNLFASYGYFCAVFPIEITSANELIFDKGETETDYVYDFTLNSSLNGVGVGSKTQNAIALVGYIDHLNKNTSKIAGGKFNNKIDFTKIISMGHSRGGGVALSLYEVLLYKSNANSCITQYNTTFDSSNIKCIVALAPDKTGAIDSTNSNFYLDGTTVEYYQKGITAINYTTIDGSNVSKFKLEYNVPTIYIYPEFDQDTDAQTLGNYKCTNIDSSGNVINDKKVLIIKKLNHFGAANWSDYNPAFTRLRGNRSYNLQTNEGLRFNNMSSRIKYAASKVLQFISNAVYSSGINIDNLNNRLDYPSYESSIMSCFETTEHIKLSNIIKNIDGFTSSSPLFTTNIPISGYTFGDSVDSQIKNNILAMCAVGYTAAINSYSKGLLYYIPPSSTSYGATYPSDVFDKLIGANSNGLLFTFTDGLTTSYFSYSYTPPNYLDLSGCSFIHVNAAQIKGSTYNLVDETPCYFALRLYGPGGTFATLGSFNYSNGIPEYPANFFVEGFTFSTMNHINPIKFRIQDFLNKNPTLGITSIQEMRLMFGSSWGTTQGTIFLDSIVGTN